MAVTKKIRKSSTLQSARNRRLADVRKTGGGKSQAFAIGSPVEVHFGARNFVAKVLGVAKGRVTVEIRVDDEVEPIITSYSSQDVHSLP